MLKPRNDYVLVERIKADKQTPGGILIPDSAQEKANKGRVLAVGPGKMTEGNSTFARVEIGLNVGDVVYSGRYTGHELKEDDGKLFIKSDDILAVE